MRCCIYKMHTICICFFFQVNGLCNVRIIKSWMHGETAPQDTLFYFIWIFHAAMKCVRCNNAASDFDDSRENFSNIFNEIPGCIFNCWFHSGAANFIEWWIDRCSALFQRNLNELDIIHLLRQIVLKFC